jgi:hypothetical protein
MAMTTSPTTKATMGAVAVFGRLLSNSKGEMSPELARYVLTLAFSDAD